MSAFEDSLKALEGIQEKPRRLDFKRYAGDARMTLREIRGVTKRLRVLYARINDRRANAPGTWPDGWRLHILNSLVDASDRLERGMEIAGGVFDAERVSSMEAGRRPPPPPASPPGPITDLPPIVDRVPTPILTYVPDPPPYQTVIREKTIQVKLA
jgi:hypothetical protein